MGQNLIVADSRFELEKVLTFILCLSATHAHTYTHTGVCAHTYTHMPSFPLNTSSHLLGFKEMEGKGLHPESKERE